MATCEEREGKRCSYCSSRKGEVAERRRARDFEELEAQLRVAWHKALSLQGGLNAHLHHPQVGAYPEESWLANAALLAATEFPF